MVFLTKELPGNLLITPRSSQGLLTEHPGIYFLLQRNSTTVKTQPFEMREKKTQKNYKGIKSVQQ
ncbi:hypothetical protein DSO57_1011785 [Entomophthora muscae]|uniref:Uncharacterized protein n=1 Tax=Entomophthora muscae TaxID=34485 RepID=A0ACC2TGV1_9FUNG|nr:hypothetical protein DSO57_1011785 [Entomophthora muscae]